MDSDDKYISKQVYFVNKNEFSTMDFIDDGFDDTYIKFSDGEKVLVGPNVNNTEEDLAKFTAQAKLYGEFSRNDKYNDYKVNLDSDYGVCLSDETKPYNNSIVIRPDEYSKVSGDFDMRFEFSNTKLGSVLEINEEVLRFDHRISMYEAICQNNILFTKEIDIENINLDFLDEAVKITNENNFVESRRHLYENKNYDELLKHYAENDIIDKDNYYKLVAERAIFDSTKDFRTKEADYLAAKNNVEMKEQELNDAVNDLKIKEQAFIKKIPEKTRYFNAEMNRV